MKGLRISTALAALVVGLLAVACSSTTEPSGSSGGTSGGAGDGGGGGGGGGGSCTNEAWCPSGKAYCERLVTECKADLTLDKCVKDYGDICTKNADQVFCTSVTSCAAKDTPCETLLKNDFDRDAFNACNQAAGGGGGGGGNGTQCTASGAQDCQAGFTCCINQGTGGYWCAWPTNCN